MLSSIQTLGISRKRRVPIKRMRTTGAFRIVFVAELHVEDRSEGAEERGKEPFMLLLLRVFAGDCDRSVSDREKLRTMEAEAAQVLRCCKGGELSVQAVSCRYEFSGAPSKDFARKGTTFTIAPAQNHKIRDR